MKSSPRRDPARNPSKTATCQGLPGLLDARMAPSRRFPSAEALVRNVVELSVDYVPSPVDARSPNAITVGSGPGMVHRDGLAIPVTWSRETAEDPFTFTSAANGRPVLLGIGRTFVELERS